MGLLDKFRNNSSNKDSGNSSGYGGSGGEALRLAAAIGRFWSWWSAEGADATAAAIADGDPHRIVDAMAAAVHDIDPALAWELGPGSRGAQHCLVVSADGNPDLRPTARRWLLAAPARTETWEYADLRQPTPDIDAGALELDGLNVPFDQTTVSARRNGAHLDISVHHPAFEGLEDSQQKQLAFLMLDGCLGEEAVETWIGHVETSAQTPLEPIRLSGLRAAVRDLRQDFTDAEGEPAWVMMQGQGPGGPILASAQVPLSPVTAANLDTHVVVEVPFADQTDEGLPGAGSLQALRDLEDHLAQRLGRSGRVVAHESHLGRRVLHVYVDGMTPTAEQVRAAVAGWDQGEVTVRSALDPAWARVAHLRA